MPHKPLLLYLLVFCDTGGPGNAILVKEKGPTVPIWHTNGEFTNLVTRSRLKHQTYRPWFFYGA